MTGNTTMDHALSQQIWAAIRDEWRLCETLRGIAAGVPFDRDQWPHAPVVIIVDGGALDVPWGVKGQCNASGDRIELFMPHSLADVHCPVSELGTFVIQVVAHELEHAQQVKFGGLRSVRLPDQTLLNRKELERAQAWLGEYYENGLEFCAHARMLAVALVERFGHPTRASENIEALWETDVWRLIASRIYSSIVSDPQGIAHNNGPVAGFRHRLKEEVMRELDAMARGG